MNDKKTLDKTAFTQYAKALLKNHNIVFEGGANTSVNFPENAPAELLAHSIFSSDSSTVFIRKNTTVLGGIKFQTKRSYDKDCKVVELVASTEHVNHLIPIHLAH